MWCGSWREERLSAAGGPGVARFRTQIATLTREPSAGGGVFAAATERLTCTLRCRLEIRGEDGSPAGFAEAEVRRAAVRPAGSPAERARAAEEIVRAAGADLNVEFEYQLRRNLRAALAPRRARRRRPRRRGAANRLDRPEDRQDDARRRCPEARAGPRTGPADPGRSASRCRRRDDGAPRRMPEHCAPRNRRPRHGPASPIPTRPARRSRSRAIPRPR